MRTSIAEVISLVAASTPPTGMQTKVIAIDGPGGAGKSTLAELLARSLGDANAIVHTDDFASADNPIDWWPRLRDEVLIPLSRNETARYQRYDWDSQALAEWHDLELGGTIILEGVSASRDTFRPYLALCVWIDTPREERLRRGLARDGEAARPQWDEWMASEDEHFAREHTRDRADIEVDGTQPLNP